MRKKTKILTFAFLIVLLSSLLAVSALGALCSGAHRRSWGLYKDACWDKCGSDAKCNNYFSGDIGKCELGQMCGYDCQCKWIDRDLDSYTITGCGGNVGKSGWLTFDEIDILSGEEQGWTLDQTIGALALQIVQTKGFIKTSIHSVEVYDQNGLYKKYDYLQTPFRLTRNIITKFSQSFEDVVNVKKVIVKWDDNNKSNKAKLELFIGQGSPTCDCDDKNPYTHPGAKEICDNADNDCDGKVDEDEVCEKYVYLCKSDDFVIQREGLGKETSFGYCADGTWCSGRAVGESGLCSYETKEEDIGPKKFYAYVCDIQSCYKFTEGSFMVCGYGWDCTAMCVPGECNSQTKEWCNAEGIWQTEKWCQSECGKADSTCGGNCENKACDLDAKKWCKNGYWVNTEYCGCDVCGSKDSSCTTGCACTDTNCDTVNDKYCDKNIWKSSSYCLTGCCIKDYNCYTIGACSTCESGTCNTKNNQYCLGGKWTSENYCNNCEKYDYDCGSSPCEDGICDTIENKYCKEGIWINPGENYCNAGYCGLQDESCGCSNSADDCCDSASDGTCDSDCLEGADPDCGVCTVAASDCCDDTPDNGCDPDCIYGVDPDCQTCKKTIDDCCSDLADANCDKDCTKNSDPDCISCSPNSGDCCAPGEDEICDPDCIEGVDPDCPAKKCEEKWVCKKWDKSCTGLNDKHVCLDWADTNNCNTFFDKPDNTQDCFKEFTCTPKDDKDGDNYPSRACYDPVKQKILDILDCNDNDASQHPGTAEICNGKDDNCDNAVDEDCPCTKEITKICGRNEGICKEGIQACIAGKWSVCGGSGYIGPKKEACDDGLDNNCDGYIDENCKCIEEEQQACGVEIGICKKGWQACYNGTFGSVCNDEIKGVTEICNNKLDDDCDSTLDGDDSNCQVLTPLITGPEHCTNRKQDADETGVDCGGIDCPSCEEQPPACDYGIISEKCICGKAAYRTGYCCNGKYSLIACADPSKDSDDDGCNDDKEFQLGTDPNNGDTDGDGLLDCDSTEQYPLCNEDGTCDAEKDYPETLENCPTDCGKKGIGWLTWAILILIILALIFVGAYLYAKSKGYKLSDLFKKKKKEEFRFPFWSSRTLQKPLTNDKTSSIEKAPATTSAKRNIIKLKVFVKESLNKGYTKLQIRQSASKAGWKKEEIEEALKEKKSKYKLI